jgi:ATP-dependent helicase/nuclease subunit B
MTHRPNVFTIPATGSFLDRLADGLLRYGPDLSRALILLPTSRSVTALTEKLRDRLGPDPDLLPEIRPLEGLGEGTPLARDIPPALSPLARQMLLTKLVLARGDPHLSPAGATALAESLARFLDDLLTEQVPFTALQGLVPEDLAQHWGLTLEFLRLLTDFWPSILESQGVIDAADRRNRLFAAQVAAWRAQPPTRPIIAAGSTGSVKATADLLACIATLPTGAVILPGLDLWMEAEVWQSLDEVHPQYALSRLLARMDLPRSAVRIWGSDILVPEIRLAEIRVAETRLAETPRQRFLAESLTPAPFTPRWQALRTAPLPPTAFQGIERVDCPDPDTEARVIALRLRGFLEQPTGTAILITEDRSLALRVRTALQRWGIRIADSAGIPVSEHPVGVFLMSLLDALLPGAGPVPLLALLKHKFMKIDVPGFLDLAERLALRGPRPAPGFEGLAAALDAVSPDHFKTPADRDQALTTAAALRDLVAGVGGAILTGRTLPFVELLDLHIALAERLAQIDPATGQSVIWQGTVGESTRLWLDALHSAGAGLPPMTPFAYADFLRGLLRQKKIFDDAPATPRLAILGALEARLLAADLMILAGLNEGTWPRRVGDDPWLSRPLRLEAGLGAPDRLIGLAAHDFVAAFHAPQVLLTRSATADGSPTLPSRWLLRMDSVLAATNAVDALAPTAPWVLWAGQLDLPAKITPMDPPEAHPPVAVRPRSLPVTAIESWLRDPYAIYARYILALSPLDPIDADPTNADQGMFIHKVLADFSARWPSSLPPDAEAELLKLGRAAFAPFAARPALTAFWWPRFRRIAAWFILAEQKRRPGTRPVRVEDRGTLDLNGFTLTARVDRIDQRADGSMEVIDYKTGTPPKSKDVDAGLAPQLPLTALILEQGGFKGLSGPVEALSYWHLSGRTPAGKIQGLKDVPGLIANARHGILDLIATFADPATGYKALPDLDIRPAYSDYTHLERWEEWGNLGDLS